MGEVTLVGVGAAADEDVRAGVLLARVLELSGADEGALLGAALLDEVIAGAAEDVTGALEMAATVEEATAPDGAGLEDRTPHLPKPFWQPSPQWPSVLPQ
jgi:hypothetical protein